MTQKKRPRQVNFVADEEFFDALDLVRREAVPVRSISDAIRHLVLDRAEVLRRRERKTNHVRYKAVLGSKE